MTTPLPLPVEVTNPRWLCGNCGREHPLDGPAWPVCGCGCRCAIVTGDNLELRAYVGTPEERVENAHRAYAERYRWWSWRLADLRAALDMVASGVEPIYPWDTRPERVWTALVADANALALCAENVDRVEREAVLVDPR